MTKNAWDSNFVTCSPKYIAVAWQVGGGGAVGILDVNKPGKLATVPLFTGHKGPVLDLQFSPFHDNILATVSEDGYGKIWQVPDGMKDSVSEPVQNLKGHKRKIGCLDFNGVAENVLATAGTDYDVKIWDISTGQDKLTVSGHGDLIQSVQWNYSGDILVSFCKDHFVRTIDPRAGKVVQQIETHTGVKGGRAIWLGKHDKVMSVGFAKSSERQYFVLDTKAMDKPMIGPVTIDNSAGMLMPFYDEDTEILFLAGKGDGNIRYYEIEPSSPANEMIHFISQYSSSEPNRGCGFMPKRGCDVNTNEIVRIYKVAGSQLHPLSFKVPRKSDMFQDDIFPACRSDEAALTANQWFGGENSAPKTKSLEGGFVAKSSSGLSFEKQEEEKELSGEELKKAYEELKKKVVYLEAELAKANAKGSEN